MLAVFFDETDGIAFAIDAFFGPGQNDFGMFFVVMMVKQILKIIFFGWGRFEKFGDFGN